MPAPIDLGEQPELQTSRLWLRAFEDHDASAVFEYASNPRAS